MIQCKRVYDPQESSDGYRVLVDRLWPRGIKKEALACDEWCKELTPSAELRKAFHGEAIDFAHFSQRYRQELDAHRETGLPGAAPAPPPPPNRRDTGKKNPTQKSPGFGPRPGARAGK
ncbi:DUF488 domain-containing protein, partial [Klebsiella pneumoniae]|uniref:DUF488 domain-containing protein n=1 Tax=Klebsiella pneumoniae TaxID=573 RepID=UPI003D7EFE02